MGLVSLLGGMGKVAGNLNTELIVEYLVRKKYYDYEFEDDNIEYLRNFMTKRCDFLNRNLGGESTGTDPDTSQKVTVIEDDTR